MAASGPLFPQEARGTASREVAPLDKENGASTVLFAAENDVVLRPADAFQENLLGIDSEGGELTFHLIERVATRQERAAIAAESYPSSLMRSQKLLGKSSSILLELGYVHRYLQARKMSRVLHALYQHRMSRLYNHPLERGPGAGE